MAYLFYKYGLRGTDSPDGPFLSYAIEEQNASSLKWHERFHQINVSFSPRPRSLLSSHPYPASILNSGLTTMFIAIWKGALSQTRKLLLLKSIKEDWGPESYINLLLFALTSKNQYNTDKKHPTIDSLLN